MTLADVWFEPAHDRIYGAADTRIARGPGNVLTEHGPKLLPINILCKQPGPSGFVDRPAYTTTVGFAYAGSTLSALATHALANTLLQNLAGPDGVPPPGVHHVAFSIGDVACRYMREVCQLSGTSGLFSAIVFGFCANTNKFRAFTLTPVLDPRPIRVRVTERDLQGKVLWEKPFLSGEARLSRSSLYQLLRCNGLWRNASSRYFRARTALPCSAPPLRMFLRKRCQCLEAICNPSSSFDGRGQAGRRDQQLPQAFFFNCFNPETQCEVLALGIAKLPAQLFLISLFQNFKIEWNGLRQVLYVVSIPLEKREPRLRNGFIGMRRQAVLP